MRELKINIPIRSDQAKLDILNEKLSQLPVYKPLKTTEQHIMEAIEKIYDEIYEVGDNNGWFIDDSIKIEVKISYEPLNK